MRKDITVTRDLAYTPGPGIFVPANQFTLPKLPEVPPAQPLAPSTGLKVGAGVLGFLSLLTGIITVLMIVAGEVAQGLIFAVLTGISAHICHVVLVKRYRPARQALIDRCDMALNWEETKNGELEQAQRILDAVNKPKKRTPQRTAQERIAAKAAELQTARTRAENDVRRIQAKAKEAEDKERLRAAIIETETRRTETRLSTFEHSETVTKTTRSTNTRRGGGGFSAPVPVNYDCFPEDDVRKGASGELEYWPTGAPIAKSLADEDIDIRLFIERASVELNRNEIPMTPQELYERGLAAEKTAISEYADNLNRVVDDLLAAHGLELQVILYNLRKGMGQAEGLTRTEREEILRRYAERRLDK